MIKKQIHITPTEAKILNFLSAAKTEREIAKIQKCSLNTVRKHTANIRRKTGFSRAIELVLWWQNDKKL